MGENLFTVRKFEAGDADDCAMCFYYGFFDCPLTKEDREFLRDYVQILIEKCSFTYVALADGKVIGFISGSYKKSFNIALARKSDTKRHYWAWIKCFAKFSFGGYKLSPAFKEQFDAFFRRIRERNKHTPMACDCELVALTSRREYRRGLGTALWMTFAGRCASDGVKRIRLFTDSDASYDFYERRGFTRVWSKPYSFGGGSSYVYEFKL